MKLLLLLLLWGACGCAKMPSPPLTPDQLENADACRVAYKKAIKSSETCPDAQLKLDVDPACKPFGKISLNCEEFEAPKPSPVPSTPRSALEPRS